MKRIIFGMTFLGAVFSASLWAHHMAEGIISDELWEDIDFRLEDSQHDEMLSLSDPDMEVETDDDTGAVFLESVVRVDFESEVPEEQYESLVLEVIDEHVLPATEALNRIPSSTMIATPDEVDSQALFITYELVDGSVFRSETVDYALIITYEPIGKGNSQDVPPEVVPESPHGNRNGG